MQKYNNFVIPAKRKFPENLTVMLVGDGSNSPLDECEDSTIIEKKISLIYNVYNNADIIYIGNLQCAELKKKIPNLKILENKEFNKTNDCSNLKLGFLYNTNKNVLIIKINAKLNSEVLKKILESFKISTIISNDKHYGVGATIVDNKVTCIAYGLERQWIPCILICEKEIQEFYDIIMKSNNSKMLHEIINKYLEKSEIGVVS